MKHDTKNHDGKADCCKIKQKDKAKRSAKESCEGLRDKDLESGFMESCNPLNGLKEIRSYRW